MRGKLSIHLSVRCATALLCLAALPARGAVWYVRAAAGGPIQDGTTWARAFSTLQAGLQAARAGDQVWVAAGTYRPADPNGNRSASFALASGVALYGGFEGKTDTGLDQRNWVLNRTVLSGDLNGNDAPDSWTGYAENSHTVVTAAGVDATAILDGFAVTGGSFAEANGAGAGMTIAGGRPTISHCVFRRNLSRQGGAMYLTGAAPTLSGCRFEGNVSRQGRGGAVYAALGSAPAFNGCDLSANSSVGMGSPGDGGAMFLEGGTTVSLRRCTFTGNVADQAQTAPEYANGGAICSLADSLTAEDCAFQGNSAASGGAVWNGSLATFAGCVLSDNTADSGGAVLNFIGTTALTNCTWSRNSAPDSAVENRYGGTLSVANSIAWGNPAGGAGARAAQVHNAAGTVTLRYSCIQGLLTPIAGQDPPNPADYPGCIDKDPLFLGAAGSPGEYRLKRVSPAIDAGSDAAVPAGMTVDLDGSPRMMGAHVDMGAYEFNPAPAYAIADVRWALRIAGGTATALGSDLARLGISHSGRITVLDAALIARKVAGLDPNP